MADVRILEALHDDRCIITFGMSTAAFSSFPDPGQTRKHSVYSIWSIKHMRPMDSRLHA
jgi:hypothetical protein